MKGPNGGPMQDVAGVHAELVLAGNTVTINLLDEANKPLVVRLDGNNVEEGRRILAEANHPLVIQAETMDSGADKAAELANK